MAEEHERNGTPRRAFLGALGVGVTAGCLTPTETTRVAGISLQNLVDQQSVVASVSILKNGEERLDRDYDLSPGEITTINREWMTESPGEFVIDFASSSVDKSEYRHVVLPKRPGGSCYRVALRIEEGKLIVARGVVEDRQC